MDSAILVQEHACQHIQPVRLLLVPTPALSLLISLTAPTSSDGSHQRLQQISAHGASQDTHRYPHSRENRTQYHRTSHVMSGLEPLVALGLACNVLQITGTAGKTITLIRQCYKDGALDPALNDHATELAKLADRVKGACSPSTATTAGAPSSTSRNDQVVDLGTKCVKATQSLQKEVASINSTTGKTKLLRALGMSFKAYTRKGRLDDSGRTMTQAEQFLASGLLTAILRVLLLDVRKLQC